MPMRPEKEMPGGGGANTGQEENEIIDNIHTGNAAGSQAPLCSGYGQWHSPNNEKYPRPYISVSLPEIRAMLESPPSTAKEKAQWFIPSILMSRVHAEQLNDGLFYALWFDFDEVGGLTFDDVVSRASCVLPDFSAYTSRGATEQKQKTRVIVPLSEPVTGELFVILQKILNDKFEAEGITPDRANERPGQVCYLPNKGDYYRYYIEDEPTNDRLTDLWAEEIKQECARIKAEAEAAESRREQARLKAMQRMESGCKSPIEAFNAEYSIPDMFERYGAVRCSGGRLLSPNSESGNPAITLTKDGKKWLSAHGSDAGIGKPTKNGTMGDAFDLYIYYEHGGDRDAAIKAAGDMFTVDGDTLTKANQREYMRNQAGPDMGKPFDFEQKQESTGEPSAKAKKLAKDIEKNLIKMLQIDPKNTEVIGSLEINALVIDRMIHGSFWSGQKSKLFLLNNEESLNQFLAAEAYNFLAKTFGKVVNAGKVRELAADVASGGKKEVEKFISRAGSQHKTAVMDYLKYHNQRESIEWRVDMFANISRLELREDDARIILTHRPFQCQGKYEQAIVDDFKAHFARFDELLTFIVMSRFVLDRKKSYLWIQADSDWGKGFILGILKTMRCCVETSMKEIEAMLEGKPSGRSPKDFKRAFVLVIDEFKTVKSELKQLQSEISLSPKNQLVSSVEVFAKLFLSAESVGSLVTENGVEDQFCNRMSIFKETGSLVTRPAYQAAGNPAYFQSILAYTVEQINKQVAEMQQKGRKAAQTHAEKWLDGFISRYGLDTMYERFSASLPQMADEIARHWRYQPHDDRVISTNTGTYVTHPAKMIEDYFETYFDKSHIGSLRKKKQELLELISDDGGGVKTHRVNGQHIKAVRLTDVF